MKFVNPMEGRSQKYHKSLAEYFSQKPLFIDKRGVERPNVRKLIEQPWQETKTAIYETKVDLWDIVINTLCNLYFIEAKSIAGMFNVLLEDYQQVLNNLPERHSDVSEKIKYKERNIRWTTDIIEYSKKWSILRKLLSSGKLVDIAEPELPIPPQSGFLSNRNLTNVDNPWSEDNSPRLSKLVAFERFIKTQATGLMYYAQYRGFTRQCAINYPDFYFIHKDILNVISDFQIPCLLHRRFKPFRSSPVFKYQCSFIAPVADSQIACVISGGYQVVAVDKRAIRVWDMENGCCLHTSLELKDKEYFLAVTPDGTIALTGIDKTLFIWNLTNGECMNSLNGHEDTIDCASITPDGRRVVSAGGWYDKAIRVWDIESGQCIHTLFGHTQTIGSICITSDGQYAVSGSWQEVRMWQLDRGECVHVLKPLPGHVESLALTPDGKKALISYENVIQLWDLANEQCIKTFIGHQDKIRSLNMTPDGSLAVSSTYRFTIPTAGFNNLTEKSSELWVWDLNNGNCISKLEGHCNEINGGAKITPDGKRVISSHRDNTIRVWDIETGENKTSEGGHSNSILDLSTSPDGKVVVSCSYDHTIRLWDIRNGQSVGILEGHTKRVNSVCITPEGRRLISASDDNTIRIWDIGSAQCLQIFLAIKEVRFSSVCITPDGQRIIAADAYNRLIVLNLETGQYIHELNGHRDFINCICVTPDGLFAVSASNDKSIRLWNLKNGNCEKVLEGHSEPVNRICITPDAHRILSASDDNTVRLWDLDKGICIKIFKGHTNKVRSVCLSPNGLYAFSVGYDLTLRIWDLKNGASVALFLASTPIESVTISQESSFIVCGTITGEIIMLEPICMELGPGTILNNSYAVDYERYLWDIIENSHKDVNQLDFVKILGHMNALIFKLQHDGREINARRIIDERDILLKRKFAAHNMEVALDEYYKDLAVNEKYAAEYADSLNTKNDLAISYQKFGDTMLDHDEIESALCAYERSLAIMEELLSLSDNAHVNDWNRTSLCSIYERIGNVSLRLGETMKALVEFQKSLEIYLAFDKANPGNEYYQNSIAANYMKIGDVYMIEKRAIYASIAYNNSIQIYESIKCNYFKKEWLQSSLVQCYQSIGNAYSLIGNKNAASEAYLRSLLMAKELFDKDPINEQIQRTLWIANWTVANTFEQNNDDNAMQYFQNAYRILLNMKNTGSVLSPQDEAFLQKLKSKIQERIE